MSCLLLLKHHSIHTIQDDMESFVHIILYHGLRYFQHSEADSTHILMNDIFDYRSIKADGTRLGGKNKKLMFKEGKGSLGHNQPFRFDSPPLDQWITMTFAAVKQWIEFVDPDVEDSESLLMAMLGRASRLMPAPKVSVPSAHHYLKDHQSMATILHHCLSSHDWPLNDSHVDILPLLRQKMKLSIRQRESENTDEDGSVGGSRKRSRMSKSFEGSSLTSGSSHSMNTRSRTRQSNTGGSRRI
jgi:hypothetical protein